MKTYLALPIVMLMLAIPLVQACMSPYDQYAVEVLLNKPGVEYNSSISILSTIEADNGTFILEVWEDRDGPHVRVEIPLARHLGAYWSYTGSVVITSGTIQKLIDLGWIATSITQNGSSIDVLQKGNVTIKIRTPKRRASVSKVTATGPNPEELTDALKEFFNATGANCMEFSLISGSEEKSAYNPSEVDAGKVLSRALDYLLENKVIICLTSEDVAQIAKVAEWGRAGYNGKIGWYETENGTYAWIPYYESPNATLIKCGWVGPPIYGNASPTEGNGTLGSGPKVTGHFGNHTGALNPAIDTPQNEMIPTTKTKSGSAICGPASLLTLVILPILAKKKKN